MTDIELPPGADPMLAIPRPDVGFFAWQFIRSQGHVVVWEYAATENNNWNGAGGWLTTTFIQVDCRAHVRERAAQLGDRCRRLLNALPWVPWNEGVVCDVTCIDGPRWMPDENGSPRYVARYSISHHPRQTQIEPLQSGPEPTPAPDFWGEP